MQDISERAWPVFAGVDWGGENHQLCVVAPDGKRLLETRVSHDVARLRQLDQHLSGFGAQVPVAIERAEGLLVEHLQATGHAVFPVSPRISARARERYKVAAVKDDRFDAFVLADTLRFDHAHWRPLSIPSPLLAEIKALTRDRDRLLETQQPTESQLRMILEAYHPAPVRLFSSVDRQITLSFVTDYPTPANASRVKTTRMAGFLSRHHYTGRVPAQTLADRMRQNLLSTAEHPDAPIFASFPGIGPVLTAVLLAEIGEDRARFPHAEVLLAEAGLAPVTRSSGRSRSVRFRYAANSRLREATMWWAFQLHQDVTLGGRRVPRRPRAEGPALPPRAPRPRRALDPHPLALLDQPRNLRPGPPRLSRTDRRRLSNDRPSSPAPSAPATNLRRARAEVRDPLPS